MAELLGLHADAPGARDVTLSPPRALRRASVIQPAARRQRGFQRFVSEFFDWNDPPIFKSFLRLDAEPARAAHPLLRRQRLRRQRARPAGRGRVHDRLVTGRVRRPPRPSRP